MKNFIQMSLLASVLFLCACSNEDNSNPTKEENNSIVPTENDKINHFIWRGLNNYYLWQKDVTDLQDNRFADMNELYTYFRGFSNPESVFDKLLNKPADRFSWMVDDYIALENSFQGITLNNGMEFGLVRNKTIPSNIFGFVRYVIPGSSAHTNGVTRGMIFNAVDGNQLTDTNYRSLLFGSNTSYTITLADYNLGDPVSNDTKISLTKEQLQENPIAISKVITDETKKIGYLMYNQFANSFDSQLNAAFANFKSEDIDDLIIDLRYNGGGSISTAIYLASMVTGQFNGSLFSKNVWNEKVMKQQTNPSNLEYNFTNQISSTNGNETINSLGLKKVYFIVSGSSASASELVINGLSAYIDVRLIGTKTVGKQVGSVTLYDSDSFLKDGTNLNTNHTYAMQPIVLEIKNSKDQNSSSGYTPGSDLPGIELGEDYGNMGVLGERSDPLLDKTLKYITTGARGNFSDNAKSFESIEIFNSKLALPSKNNMYVELNSESQ